MSREKPLQLFWTKRLSSFNPLNMDEEERTNERVSLPPKLSFVGPGITDHMLLASISTHLHISKDSAMGQQTTMSWIDKVSDEDISGQEGEGGAAEACHGSKGPGMRL